VSYRVIETSKGEEILVSESDYELLSELSWSTNATGYAYAYVKGSGRKNRKIVNMHRFITNPPSDMRVDHMNRNKLDNRRENLRICTNSQNLGNSIGYSKKTRYKGIQPLPGGKWRARINIAGKTIHLGVAVTEQEAADIYDVAAIKHYGSFALTNKGVI